MTGSDPTVQNPYVGPRPFERGEHLLGRDREITDLYYLLSAERIVLLHSPSGAGKSSLINAGLLPRLRERFDVWQPTRVNLQPPPDVAATANRFVLSAVLGFEQGIPKQMRRTPQQLAGMSLLEHARSLPRPDGVCPNKLLVFDQFEEVLTTDPLAVEARHKFFQSLGDLLRDPTYWALIALREDYLAPLDPYAQQVPTHLMNRFRIDLLAPEQAVEAVAIPAEEKGRSFETAAVDKLVQDLSRVRMQQADGSFADQPGLSVEPMQLQVVCRQMWDRLPPDCTTIRLSDVEAFADVTRALALYYATAVGTISSGNACTERKVREWIGEQLITPEGIRSQVLRGTGLSEGLQNALIEKLVNTHLLRSEPRGGVVWYELAHDRLIEPVRTDNAAWRDKNLHPVQKRAAIWDKQDRPAGMLLGEQEVVEALAWAHGQTTLTPDERDFLTASTEAQTVRAKARRQARRNRQLTFVSTIGFLIAIGTALYALNMARRVRESRDALVATTRNATWSQWLADGHRVLAESREAEAQEERRNADLQKAVADRQTEVALARQLMAEARSQSDQDPNLLPLSTLLALESMKRSPSVEADEFLRQNMWLLRTPLKPPMPQSGADRTLALSPNAEAIAVLQKDGSVHVSSTQDGRVQATLQHDAQVFSAVWSPDCKLLATVSRSGSMVIWEAGSGRRLKELRTPTGHIPSSLTFSAHADYVAASDSLAVYVWQVNGSATLVFRTAEDRRVPVGRPLFTRDDHYLITARGGKATLFYVGDWQLASTLSYDAPVNPRQSAPALVESPDGRYFAVGYDVFKWTKAPERAEKMAQLQEIATDKTSFSPDGSVLAKISGNTVQLRYGNRSGTQWAKQVDLPQHDISSFAFSSQTGYAATGSHDGTARFWKLPNAFFPGKRLSLGAYEDPVPRELGRFSHEGQVFDAAFSRDGSALITVTKNVAVQRWPVNEKQESLLTYQIGETYAAPMDGDESGVIATSVSTNGTMLARGTAHRITLTRSIEMTTSAHPVSVSAPAGRAFTSFDLNGDGSILVAALGQAPEQAVDPQAYPHVNLTFWSTSTGKLIAEWPWTQEAQVFLFDPQNKFVAIANSEGTSQRPEQASLQVHDLHTGKALLSLKAAGLKNTFLFSPSGRYFAAIDADGHLRVWDSHFGTGRSLLSDGESAKAISFSGRSDTLAASLMLGGNAATGGSPARIARAWREPDWHVTHEVRHPVQSDVDWNTAIALTPDGSTLVTADWSEDKFLRRQKLSFWQEGANRLRTETELSGSVIELRFNANGRDLAISTAKRISIWDTVLNQQAAILETAAAPSAALFSPDNRYVFALYPEGDAAVWFWGAEQLSASLCKHLSLNLSREEWQHFLPGEPYRKTCPRLPEGTGHSEGILASTAERPTAAERPKASQVPAASGLPAARTAALARSYR